MMVFAKTNEGDKLSPLVNPGLRFLLNRRRMRTAMLRTQQLGTLHSPARGVSVIAAVDLPHILPVLLESIKDVPNVAEKVCGAIYFLAQGYEDAVTSSSLLSLHPPSAVSVLAVTERTDADDSRLRSSAYETLNEVVRRSNIAETTNIFSQLLPVILTKLPEFYKYLDDKVVPFFDGIMSLLLHSDLSNGVLHRSVNPPIFSCLSLAIGESAVPRLRNSNDAESLLRFMLR